MLANIFKKIFGSKNDREIRKLGKTVAQINQLEAALAALNDVDLKAETLRLRGRGWTLAVASMNSYPKPLPWSAKPPIESWACATSMCR